MVRKDAARNRELLVEAARTVFADRGFGATLDDIARHAGVGTGTAYRHFPNKQAIAAEVLADAAQQIAEDAEDAMAVEDPWQAVIIFFENTAARLAADRGLYQNLAGQSSVGDKARIWPQIVENVTRLFDRAKSAGAIRSDAEPEDAALILAMLGAPFALSAAASIPCWRRYLAMLLDGLRATDRPGLPCAAPRFASLDDVIAVSKGR
jgi:AcrR family transcriptional regulator